MCVCCRVKSWSKIWEFLCWSWSKICVFCWKLVQALCYKLVQDACLPLCPYVIALLGMCRITNSVNWRRLVSKIVWLSKKMFLFFWLWCALFGLLCLCWLAREGETDKILNQKANKRVVLVWSSNMRNIWSGFFAKLAKHYFCLEGRGRHFRAHYLFGPPFLQYFSFSRSLSQNTIKIVVSRDIGQTKTTPFLWKSVLGMGEKVAVTNCVFQKPCSAENIHL